MIYFLLYLAGAIFFCFWDALIGFGFEFDDTGKDGPPAWVIAMIWPLAFPLCFLYRINETFLGIKKWRLNKARQKEKKRIALLEEEQKLLRIVEEELSNENQDLHKAKSI